MHIFTRTQTYAQVKSGNEAKYTVRLDIITSSPSESCNRYVSLEFL